MNSFFKTQAILVAGSVADFVVTFLFTDIFHGWYLAGNAAGNVVGSLSQFVMSRLWAFNAADQPVRKQLGKFVLMWIGNIILSAIGVYCFTHFFQLHYLISKLVISVLLGISYTYLVSKNFVFKES